LWPIGGQDDLLALSLKHQTDQSQGISVIVYD
jgi:hypothetical protein